jgi:hypothetical protein
LWSSDEFFFKLHLEVVFGFLSDLESAVNFGDDVRLFPGEVASLDKETLYHGFAIELLSIELSFGLHGRVDVSIDDKGLASHANVFFCDDLGLYKIYINDFPVLFKDIVEGIFEFVNRYFFVQVIYVNGIVGSRLTCSVFYRLVCITYLARRSFIQTCLVNFCIDLYN